MNYLEHHGVKGMKWGVRRERRKTMNQRLKESKDKTKMANDMVSRSMKKDTKKDTSFDDYVKYETEYNRRMDSYMNKSYKDVKKEYKTSKKERKISEKAVKKADAVLQKYGNVKLSKFQKTALKTGATIAGLYGSYFLVVGGIGKAAYILSEI